MSEIILTIDGVDPVDLYGEKNAQLNLVKKAYPEITIISRGSNLKLSGEKIYTQRAKNTIEKMVRMLREKKELNVQTVEDLLNGGNPHEVRLGNTNDNTTIVHGRSGKVIKAKTRNQKLLVDASGEHDIVFAIGPAGTGKTYTAVALAVRALKNRTVKKIIMTRPAVEAGENLGFLPGDLKDKVDPYLRPLYDALDDMLPSDKLDHFMATRVIEVAPLAFMRGRTLDNAFVIMDEAQNATTMQLKMFLTRLGPSAKAIITGDLSQVDLPYKVKSGLRHAMELFQGIKGIAFTHLTADDVVRHRLVKEIILAYAKDDERKRQWYEEKKAREDAEKRKPLAIEGEQKEVKKEDVAKEEIKEDKTKE